MALNRRNPNPIGFTADERQLSKNRKAAYGEKRPHPVPLGFIPPFQLIRQPDAPNVNSIKLIKDADGSSQTITVDMFTTGFQVLDFTTYKIWVYPGTVPIPTSGLEEGIWTMTIEDGSGGILYREDWCWLQESAMADFVKIEYFHQRRFEMPFGHLEFAPPFKFWHWFRTELGKPTYPLDRDVNTRLGIEYKNTITGWKEQRFVTVGDENFMDAMSLLRQMDCVSIFFLGDEIEAFRVLVTPDWEGRGDFALIEFEIRSDQVTTTFGDALPEKDYTLLPEECLGVAFQAEAEILEGGLEWVNGYYVNAANQTVPFQENDYVLIRDNSDWLVRLFIYVSPGNYFGAFSLADDTVVYNINDGEYLVQHPTLELSPPVITNIDNTNPDAFVATGFAMPNTVVEIWGRISSSSPEETLLAVGTETEFNGGIVFDPGENVSFKARVSTWQCSDIAESVWKTVTNGGGIGEAEIENTFQVS